MSQSPDIMRESFDGEIGKYSTSKVALVLNISDSAMLGLKRKSKAQELGTVMEKEKLSFVSPFTFRLSSAVKAGCRWSASCTQDDRLKWRNIETIPRFLLSKDIEIIIEKSEKRLRNICVSTSEEDLFRPRQASRL